VVDLPIRRDFLNAGFLLEAESGLLREAGDDQTRGVFDPQSRTEPTVS
jgi:predicted methyltransferase